MQIYLHPVSITRFPLRGFSPGAGLLRNPCCTPSRLRFSRGWVRKDGNIVMETGCNNNNNDNTNNNIIIIIINTNNNSNNEEITLTNDHDHDNQVTVINMVVRRTSSMGSRHTAKTSGIPMYVCMYVCIYIYICI